ncbi:hypothetical protein EDD11_000264 [Mortierella claussenii]|nr:hypothetical protein EDD11_000264 [Mortierella claussenii]
MAPDTAALDAPLRSSHINDNHPNATTDVTIKAMMEPPPTTSSSEKCADSSHASLSPIEKVSVALENHLSGDSRSVNVSKSDPTFTAAAATAATTATAPESVFQLDTTTAKEMSDSSNNGKSAGMVFNLSDLELVVKRVMDKEELQLKSAAVVVGSIVAYYCLPRLNWTIILVGVLGMGLGGFVAVFYLLAVPETTRLQRASALAHFGKYPDRQPIDIVNGAPSWASTSEKERETLCSKGVSLTENQEVQHQHVSISADIDPMVEQMISFILRDFVNVPVGLTSDGPHNIPLRASLVTMAMNVSHRLSNMRLPETALLGVYGLQSSFIVYLRAYRELRASRLPIADYVKTHANADSVFGRCYHKEERLKQFRSTARAVCQTLLSKNDQQSMALFAVMQEIMATHVLEATLEHMCDPDFINVSIIDYFTVPILDNKPNQKPIGTPDTSSITKTTTESKAQEAPISSLADSILMNAADLMDKSTLESQGSDQGVQTPVRSSTPQSSSWPTESTAFDEVDSFNRCADDTGPASEIQKAPSVVTLKQVLTNKNDHTDSFQDFMTYLQVWDAMDLAQFWLMIDVFHRQIEEGTLTSMDDLRREASSIFETYCGPDPDHDLAGIKDANNGALLRNLKKDMQTEPANCLRKPQAWALGVLETQYWEPFKIKQNNDISAKESQEASGKPNPTSPLLDTSSPQLLSAPHEPHRVIDHSLSKMSPTTPASSSLPTSSMPSPVAAFVASPRQRARSIQITDMVNGRSKTLMSTAELNYMIEIQSEGGQGWMVTRTFQQLEQLYGVLAQQFPVVQRTLFPRWRLQPSDKVCIGLKNFLRSMLAIPEVSESVSLAWFLSKEYDQNPDAPMPGSGAGQNSTTAGLISALAPISDGSAALGAAAAQGAKSALRQASEASMTAGRFFKSLGAAVGTGSSPQLLPEDRVTRGSFESERSIRSVSSTLSLSDQRRSNGALLSSSAMRLQDVDPDNQSRASFSSDTTRIGRQAVESGFVLNQAHLHTPQKPPTPHQSLVETSSRRLSDEQQIGDGAMEPTSSVPSILTGPATFVPVSSVSASTSVEAEAGTGAATYESKKSLISLLSDDELDLLIDITFRALEDVMDFSKSQSIRRMTFGMLQGLVRKSYRVAINQSFSAWVEESTSHEKAVETVRWMKDDFFWPNGEWPVVPTTSKFTSSSTASASAATHMPQTSSTAGTAPRENMDIFQIGDDQYEVGSDGIAVKVIKTHSNPSAVSVPAPVAAAAPGADAASATPAPATTVRTAQEKEAARVKARELVKKMVPTSLAAVLGREAVQRGVLDVFDMFQIKELNLGLALSVLEMTVRLVLTN